MSLFRRLSQLPDDLPLTLGPRAARPEEHRPLLPELVREDVHGELEREPDGKLSFTPWEHYQDGQDEDDPENEAMFRRDGELSASTVISQMLNNTAYEAVMYAGGGSHLRAFNENSVKNEDLQFYTQSHPPMWPECPCEACRQQRGLAPVEKPALEERLADAALWKMIEDGKALQKRAQQDRITTELTRQELELAEMGRQQRGLAPVEKPPLLWKLIDDLQQDRIKTELTRQRRRLG